MQYSQFEANILNRDVEIDNHNHSTPFFFRHFVDALFRLFYIRCKFNLHQATKSFETAVADHLLPMMLKKKAPKPIFHDEAIFEEKLHLFTSEIESMQTVLRSLRKRSKEPAQFLTLDDLLNILKVMASYKEIGLRHEHRLATLCGSFRNKI